MTTPSPEQPLDASVPHSARVWNYWLGGKDNYPADRAVGDQIRDANPMIAEIAIAQRAFLVRTVRHLVSEAGIDQFLDVGTGLPTANNTHEVAQTLNPAARVVYVDHDPLVLTHARALLTGNPEGATDYVDADLHAPERILQAAAKTLDFSRPIALVMLGITAHVVEDGEAYAVVGRLMDALAPGSFLVLCDDTNVIAPAEMDEMIRQWNEAGENPRINRTPERIAGFFDGLGLLEPGVVSVTQWRPNTAEIGTVRPLDDFGGVGRKG
ncbi:SAM-dependent methyltransferase [Nocardiopsis deserti]|uniref:SAM-dependent methyltransferase n=1 Tax=Nocardiopsis deserti TaxID=2605988 RepID=UPI0012397DB6|nr:SAM-dependent methyltransferase [Nocardiopsis deserti]